MRAYKIFEWDWVNGRLYSAIVRGPCLVHYHENIWNFPTKWGGPLCCFDTLENAEKFLKKNGDYIRPWSLWEVEIVPSYDEAVWVEEFNEIKPKLLEALPEGTVLAEAVYLIKEVKNGRNQ